MKLRNRQSVVATGDEGRAPRSWAAQVTKGLYYVALVTIVAYVGVYVANRLINFRAQGLVATSTTLVASAQEGRVSVVPFQVGDTVAMGAVVAMVEPGVACQAPDTSRVVDDRTELQVDRARLRIVQEQIASRRRRLEALSQREGLELDMELRRERDDVEADLERLEGEARLLGLEVSLRDAALAAGRHDLDDPRCRPELVQAPFNGTVHAIHHPAYSVVNAGEAILSLKPLEARVHVMAYVDPDELTSLYPGKELRVLFPDGSEDRGVIEKHRAASELFPELDVREYRFLESDVMVEIAPIDDRAATRWRQFDRLEVMVIGRRRGG